MDILVSIVIAVHNGAATLERCLKAVYHSEYPAFEVILVDDKSSDGSAEIAKQFPCRILSLEKHGGPSVARNLGEAHARGDILFFTDADVAILPDTIGRVVALLVSQPDIDAVIGSYTAETPVLNFVSRYKNYLHHYTHQLCAGEVTTFFTACGAIRKHVFELLCGFDESIKTTALEDVDLGYRLALMGHKVVLDGMIQVTHLKKYSQLSLLRSDLWGRAVPYTKLMLKHRMFRGKFSTGPRNVISVFLIYTLLLVMCWVLFSMSGLGGALCLAICILLIILNWDFYCFLGRKAGFCFAIGGTVMQWWGYIYSGVGLTVGLIQYVFEKTSFIRLETQKKKTEV